jgi:hypothetical protein
MKPVPPQPPQADVIRKGRDIDMNLPDTDQASELVTIEDLRTAASTLLNEYELLYRDVDRLLEKVNLLIEGLSPPGDG